MNDGEKTGEDLCAIYVDMGTTKTRVWLMRGDEVLARASKPLGVRDSAHDGSPARIRSALKELISSVRSGPVTTDLQSLGKVDVMRGEETLCVGLQVLSLVAVPGLVLTLGSHWKAIQLDAEGRIVSSITSLSGELIHAVQRQTILASSVGRDWPARPAPGWMAAGMQEQRRSGLSRTLFCVRLMELGDEGTAKERFSYLLGAFIASDLDVLARRGILTGDIQVTISGHEVIAEAWASALARMSIRARALTEEETEKAFLSGLRSILSRTIAVEGMGH
jgi:2-keto-3-deoxy-galactonokinase